MNRRQFLKSTGKVVVGLAVVPSVAKANPIEEISKLDPTATTRIVPMTATEVMARRDEYYERLRQEVVEMFRPAPEFISPSAQMQKALKEQNFPKDYLK